MRNLTTVRKMTPVAQPRVSELAQLDFERKVLYEQYEKLPKLIAEVERKIAEYLRLSLPALDLSSRQLEIIKMLHVEPHLSNKEIGARLNIAERTVKFHVNQLMNKFNVGSNARNRRELIRICQTRSF